MIKSRRIKREWEGESTQIRKFVQISANMRIRVGSPEDLCKICFYMLIPKKVKHRKWHKGRGRNKRVASDKVSVNYGAYGLKALTGAWITARQIESARRTITHFLKKGGKLWIRIFPDRPRTAKGEVRMGGGKGAVDHYVAVVRPGTILFELDSVTEEQAKEAFRLASYKLPIKTKMVVK